MRVGFASIYSWRPHVEHIYFLATLAEKAGHEAFFLTCDSDLPTCYTREMRDLPKLVECMQCRVGGVRSYATRNVSSIGACATPAPGGVQPADPDWANSSASTLGRFESDEDYASPQFREIATRLEPAVRKAYEASVNWIRRNRLDAVCLFNGRKDATRALYEAAKACRVRVLSVERTWFGDGLQIYPDEHCLELGSVHRLMREWRDRPLLRAQAELAASYVAKRFLRRNQNEWRAYNVNAEQTPWPAQGGKRILLVPSSRNEVWAHPHWQSKWSHPLEAYDALIEHFGLRAEDLVLRCHPNWSERIGRAGGEFSERYYVDWARKRGVHCIGAADPTSTLGLIEQCEAIVVANGSAALEAGVLGKQVIGIAPSIYKEAGLRDSADGAAELTLLRLRSDLSEAERCQSIERAARQTLRFAYTMIHRIPQYTRQVRAATTTKYLYDFGADPSRLDRLLKTGILVADDGEYGDNITAEDEILRKIHERRWVELVESELGAPLQHEPLLRRPLFRAVDTIRGWLPVGDR